MNKRAGLLLTSALVLAFSTALTACNAGQTTTLTGPEIVRKVRDTMRDANTAEGTVQLEVTLNKAGMKTLIGDIMDLTGMPKGGTGMALDDAIDKLPDKASADLRLWKENPNKGRVEVDSSTLPGMKGAAIVSDGTKVYAYTPLDNTVRTASLDALEKAREAMKDQGSGMMGPGMGFLSGFEDPEVAFDKLLDASDVRLLNEEKLNGRDTYKLEATPRSDAATRLGIPVFAAKYAENIIRGTKGTLWVDKDLFTPLKATLEHPSIGSLTYTGDWKLNGPIDSDRFVLQIPPGAKVEDMDEHLRNLDRSSGYWVGQHVEPETITIAEARELAQQDGWKLLEPSYLPQGATLVNVESMPPYPGMNGNTDKELHTSGITLSYSAPEVDFTIHQSPVPKLPAGSSDDKEVIVYTQSGSNSEDTEDSGRVPRGVRVFIDGSGVLTSSGTSEGMVLLPPAAFPPGVDPTANGTPAVPMSEPKHTTEQVKVRGVDGHLMHVTWDSFEQLNLFWLEADGTKSVSISGKLTKDEILKIAEGLK